MLGRKHRDSSSQLPVRLIPTIICSLLLLSHVKIRFLSELYPGLKVQVVFGRVWAFKNQITVVPLFVNACVCEQFGSQTEVLAKFWFLFVNSASGAQHDQGHLPTHTRTWRPSFPELWRELSSWTKVPLYSVNDIYWASDVLNNE